MTDPDPLPANANYIFVPSPVTLNELAAILTGIESDIDPHPIDNSYPTSSWVTHFYSAVTETGVSGYAILYDVPPMDDFGTLEVAAVSGADDAEKAENAIALIGSGNGLIGYEDVDGSQRVVVFRTGQDDIEASVRSDMMSSLSWEGASNPERKTWTKALLGLAGQNQAQMDKGNADRFIPGYAALTPNGMKIKFWAELIVAMTKFESGWDPNNVYHEPAPLNDNSIGLLQLSFADEKTYHLPEIANENVLKDPATNLEWGLTIFAHLLAQDDIIASGVVGDNRGAARYWSVLRANHKVELIKELTKKNVGI